MQNLFGRGWNGRAERGVDRVPTALVVQVRDERQAFAVWVLELAPQDGWHVRQRRVVELAERIEQDLERLFRRQVVGGPLLHDERGVALDHAKLPKRGVTLGQVLDPVRLEIEVLVLQRVRVLMGNDDLVAGPERLVALDDVEALRVGTVVGRDLTAVQIR